MHAWSSSHVARYTILSLPCFPTLDFEQVRRAVYALVWRARDSSTGAASTAMKPLRKMVMHWMDSLQLRVPGATFVLVVTHVDCVASVEELRVQTECVRRLVMKKQRALEASSATSNVLPLRVLNDGDSFRVNCLRGDGISELRNELIDITLKLPWYSHFRVLSTVPSAR